MTSHKLILSISAFATAVLLTFGVLTPVFAQLKAASDARSNCANARIPKNQELEIDVDPESGFVTVGYFDEQGQQREALFNYKSKDDFNGCTADAKRILGHIKEDVEKHDAELCTDMKEIAKGNRPLPERADIKPTLDDVQSYIGKKCQAS